MHRTLVNHLNGMGRFLYWKSGAMVLIQTQIVPTWTLGDYAKDILVSGTPARYPAGFTLNYSLRAAPDKAVRPEGSRARGKRVALKTEEERLAWMQRQGERHGFRVHWVRELAHRHMRDTKPTGDVIAINYSDFFGLLEVVDPDVFENAIRNGIGSGKAWGLGLLRIS
jgi:CRISPR system Cascade subunit CasE